ncbi:MAG: hypothetical protein GWO82_00030 [Bacteroidetes bacterium]|nr:hypothetical protein [Bacteroidota bacterium]
MLVLEQLSHFLAATTTVNMMAATTFTGAGYDDGTINSMTYSATIIRKSNRT